MKNQKIVAKQISACLEPEMGGGDWQQRWSRETLGGDENVPDLGYGSDYMGYICQNSLMCILKMGIFYYM